MQNLKIRLDSDEQIEEIDNIAGQVGLNIIGVEIEKKHDGLKLVFLSKNKTHNGKPSKEITLPELRAMVKPKMKEYLDANRNYEFFISSEKEEGFIEIPGGAIRARFYPHDPDGLEFENDFYQWWHDEDNEWIDYIEYDNALKNSRVVWQRATHPEELPFIDDEPKYTDDEVKYMDENGQGRLQSLNDQYAEIEQVRQESKEIYGTSKAGPDFSYQYADTSQARQAIKVKSGSNSDHSLDAMSFGIMGARDAQTSGGVDETLAERQSTYGNFEDVAFVTENIMSTLAKVRVNGLSDLPHTHRMALYMIASKMARIVNGDFNHLDSWHDIGGYSKLIEKLIKGE